ncbi:hypothetical protein MG293_000343 [Ovis ammon polii]|uniref:Uncharacterized protein n=1 Tax=Ovis ammon polii TaxID=230172 RepID=A0AAD4UIT9_OVIAM|nr:hypothetical protein MG293_000343 [Ovis ammon polii]
MLSVAAAPPSANSEARAPRPWGRERRRRRAGVVRRPQTVANFAASPELARARLIPYKPDQIQSPPLLPPPLIPTRIMEAAAAEVPPLPAAPAH